MYYLFNKISNNKTEITIKDIKNVNHNTYTIIDEYNNEYYISYIRKGNNKIFNFIPLYGLIQIVLI